MDLNGIVITKVVNVRTITVAKGVKRQIECRPHYGLSFCEPDGGMIIYECGGKQYLSDPGHAVFLPQGQTYTLYGLQAGHYPTIDFECAPSFSQSQHLSLAVTEGMGSILSDYAQIKKLFLFNSDVFHVRSLGLMYDIVGHLVANNDQRKEGLILKPALNYLEKHYCDPDLTVDALAAQSFISVAYFRRLFESIYYVSPKQYITSIRMNRAKELLSSRTISVAEVGRRCGFDNVYHFSSAFKNHTGYTPSDYGKQYGQQMI